VNHEYTDEAVCPHCDQAESDSWEIDLGFAMDGEGVTSCNSCGKDYFLSRHVSISYSSRPLKEGK
jgi:hypothetical protein